MDWQDVRFEVPLADRPRIRELGFGRHGVNRVEVYGPSPFWTLHLYNVRCELRMQGVRYPIFPGSIGVTPPNVISEYRMSHAARTPYIHFSLTPQGSPCSTVPALQDLQNGFTHFEGSFDHVIDNFAVNRFRAEIRLWDMLWTLAERIGSLQAVPKLHPIVHRAIQLIESELSESLNVADLARQVDISHNHLTRLFRSHLGTTVTNHIQQRRVERARQMLLHSTLPIKVIASNVGVPNIHQFNKLLRKHTGMAPRDLRDKVQKPDGAA